MQVIVRPRRSIVALLLLSAVGFIESSASPSSYGEPTELPLSSLRASCSIWKRYFGLVPTMTWAPWLQCGDVAVVIRHPRNLIGLVSIESPEQALELVRFFSSRQSYDLFDLGGAVEIAPESEYGGDNLAKSLGLEISAPTVQAREVQGICLREPAVATICPSIEYAIRRTVLKYDQNVYRVFETVSKIGLYSVLQEELVLEDVTRFGILHQSDY